MLKIILVTLLPADAVVSFQDGKTAPSRYNYGAVGRFYANVAGEKYPKALTVFHNTEGLREHLAAMSAGKPTWIVAKDTYSEEHGRGNTVSFIGSLAQCGKFLEADSKKNPPVDDVFEAFGPRIHKTKKEDKPEPEASAVDEDDFTEQVPT